MTLKLLLYYFFFFSVSIFNCAMFFLLAELHFFNFCKFLFHTEILSFFLLLYFVWCVRSFVSLLISVDSRKIWMCNEKEFCVSDWELRKERINKRECGMWGIDQKDQKERLSKEKLSFIKTKQKREVEKKWKFWKFLHWFSFRLFILSSLHSHPIHLFILINFHFCAFILFSSNSENQKKKRTPTISTYRHTKIITTEKMNTQQLINSLTRKFLYYSLSHSLLVFLLSFLFFSICFFFLVSSSIKLKWNKSKTK